MNLKCCLLVGLALAFPGALLTVEGRYFNEESRAVDDQDRLISNLFSLIERQRQARFSRFRGDEQFPGAQKKFTATTTNNNNNNNNNNVQQFQEPQQQAAASNADTIVNAPPPLSPPQPPPPPAKKEKEGRQSSGGGERIRQGSGEINLASAEEGGGGSPQALALAQSAEKSGGGHPLTQPHTAFILVVTGCTVLAAVGIIGAGVCWYKYHRSAKAASVVDYPAYGVTGPTKDRVPSPGDRKLAHSAQMYHYQHQKQQMMALQSASSGEMKHDGSDDESVEDNDDADYTVYECPGLAPTGEMEVKNPLFRGDETPSTPANDDSRPPPEY